MEIKINIDEIPLDDPKTYETFSNGLTIGVFQFSKPKMREYLTKLKPKNINDLAAMNALYRPGPMDLIPDFIDRKHGKKDVSYLHPSMEQVLKETYGVIVYQEQVMQLVRVIAGYSLAEADIVRRAMGYKDEKLMKEQEKEFTNRAVKNDYNKKVAGEIFKLILKFADYGFNKSHSVAYSILAYQTAYLKVHYPIEFMTSQLNCRYEDMDEMVLLINDSKRMKIELGLPDVNVCFSDFTIDKDNPNRILFGLSAIKNVGRNAVDNIIKERTEHGNYTGFVDFCSRIDTKLVNKKSVEGLIYAGAFDKLDSNRKKLVDYFEPVMLKYGTRRTESKGQSSLFGSIKQKNVVKDIILEPVKNHPDWSDREKLSYEKAVLGLYISSHPLADYEEEINMLATLKFGDINDFENEEVDTTKLQKVRMCGIISDFKVRQSKRGNRFATFRLEDFTGSGECVVFPKTYEDHREILRDDAIVSVIGKAEENGNSIKVITDEIIPIIKSNRKESIIDKLTIKIESEKFDAVKLYKIKHLLSGHEGETPVFINLKNGSKIAVLELQNVKIHYDQYTEKILTEIFGKENIILN